MNASADRDTTAASVRAATLAAAAIIAQQVGGKATRDALFLQHFDVDLLPRVVATAAVLAVPTILVSTRVLARYGPARAVPVAFLLSAVLQFVYAGLVTVRPEWAALLFYFHMACFGAVLVSGFWSVVNERFDPNTARRRIARIGTGATIGGVFGGVLAAGAGRLLGDLALLPLLAILHLLAAFATARAGHGLRADAPADDASAMRGLRVLAAQPYLRRLGALVVVLTAGAACMDFVFKDFTQRTFGGEGAPIDLVTFFGAYHTGLSLLTLVLQGLLTRPLLDRTGLARTASTLPVGLGFGALGVMLLPVWPVMALARAAEAALRSSTFRSAYELLYTPLPATDKRASKAIVDVGGERTGDAVGALVVQVTVLALPAAAFAGRATTLLGIALACSIVALILTRVLHAGYVRTLEDSLRRRDVALHDGDVHDRTTRTLVLRTHAIAPGPGAAAANAVPVREGGLRRPVDDPLVDAVIELRSGDARRVMRTLATQRPLPRELVGHVIGLLAWDAVAEPVIDALRACGRRSAGALIDAMLDEDEDFAVRRRAPRAIAGPLGTPIVEGLLRGLSADRFEIRLQCARALVRARGGNASRLDGARVFERVLAEVSVAPGVWDAHRILDTGRYDPWSGPGATAPAALQHVFTLLSLVLPAEPLAICLRGVISPDAQLHGTAREYLESVLPGPIRDRLFAHLERTPRHAPVDDDGTRAEMLRTMLRSQTMPGSHRTPEREGEPPNEDSPA